MNLTKKYWEGYNWKPCEPYNVSISQKRLQGIHNMLGLHYPSRDGSWCFGYDYVCGGCGMYVGRWKDARCKSAAAAINKLPPEQQQEAAASVSVQNF